MREFFEVATGGLEWPPAVAWKSTFLEIKRAIDGRNRANDPKPETTAPSQQELDDLIRKYG